MNEGRQRATPALVSAVMAFGMLASATGCQAGTSIQAAQTAIVAAQTVLPGAQATAQAGATLVSGGLSTAQPALNTLRGLLAGATLDVKTSVRAGGHAHHVRHGVRPGHGPDAHVDIVPRPDHAEAADGLPVTTRPNARYERGR